MMGIKLRLLKSALLCLMSSSVYAEEFKATEPLNLSENEMAYFVSFSIPEQQIVTLIKAAERRNIPIYLNGLVKNDMGATAKAILYLAQKYDIKGVLVDPVRFQHYGINAVPALVKKCGDKFDLVVGNVDIDYALELIRTEGDCK